MYRGPGRSIDRRAALTPAFISPRLLLSKIADSITALVLPLPCPVCGKAGREPAALSCDACRRRLVRLPLPVCPACRRYREYDSDTCPGNHDPISVSIVFALGAFDHAWRGIVHQLKYRGDGALARPLGHALAELTNDSLSRDTMIVPVPTSRQKQRERGFGHAERIARHMAGTAGLEFQPHCLRFTRRVKDQTRLSGPRRVQNLRGALSVRNPAALEGRRILIVDDILTTGATLREAGRALEAAGAIQVRAAVVAVNTGGLPDGPF